jgi:hypothetical protein
MIDPLSTSLLTKAGSAFAGVLGKSAATRLLRVEPVKRSIKEVDRQFEGRVEDVARALRRWLEHPEVQRQLTDFHHQPANRNHVVPVVLQRFVEGDFFAGAQTEETAREVLDAFFTRLNENLLRDERVGSVVADTRSDARHNEMLSEIQALRRAAEEGSAEGKDRRSWEVAVRARSDAARGLLNPHSLPRIPRREVGGKVYAAIKRGLSEEFQRIIPVLGPAGYGKSTLLGEIYDKLVEDAEVGWVVLLLATELPYEAEYAHTIDRLAIDLGKLSSGDESSLEDIVSELSAERGPGVVLIDTVDLILNRTFVPAFRTLLRGLLDSGAAVVFTCRDHEYHAFFEPRSSAFGGLETAVDHYRVPEFDDAEVVEAADAFIKHHPEIAISSGEESFGAALLALTAGNLSLRDIVRNPLRLAMLCELFGRDRNVPADLTTSRLYATYWERKISRNRKYSPGSAVLARMEKLCLDLARLAFQESQDVVRESVYLTDVREADAAGSTAASELISEDVLQPVGDGRIRFFHQTFLEYAIARLLATHSGRKDRERLVSELREVDAEVARLHWWPVFRQLLAIVDREQFDFLTGEVGLDRLPAFRAAAFAAAARQEPDALLSLLPLVRDRSEDFQQDLLEAALTAPLHLAEAAWLIALALARSASRKPAVNAVKRCGWMLSRFPGSMADRVAEILSALAENPNLTHQDRSSAAGFFLTVGRHALEAATDVAALDAFWTRSAMLGVDSKAVVLQLYARPEIPAPAKETVLQDLVSVAAHHKMREALTELLQDVAPLWLQPGPSAKWGSWLELLQAELPNGWDVIQARVVGRRASADRVLLDDLVRGLLQGPMRHLQRHMIAISEAAQAGAGPAIVVALENAPGGVSADRYRTVSRLVGEMAPGLDAEHRRRLAAAVLDTSSPEIEPTVAVLASIADLSGEARDQILELIAAQPAERWEVLASLVFRLVHSSVRAELAKPLLRLGSEGGSAASPALLKLLAELVKDDSAALDILFQMATGGSRKNALAAAALILDLVGLRERPTPEELLRLLLSRVVGVQVKGIEGLRSVMDVAGDLPEDVLSGAAAALQSTTSLAVLQPFCDLVAEWIRRSGRVPVTAIRLIAGLPARLPEQPVNAGLARSALVSFKLAAQSEDPAVVGDLGVWTLGFFRWIDVQRIGDGEGQMKELLAATARIDGGFLGQLVVAAEGLPVRNIRAAALAMRRVEGLHSVHLTDLIQMEWCPDEVRRLVLTFRGA